MELSKFPRDPQNQYWCCNLLKIYVQNEKVYRGTGIHNVAIARKEIIK